MGSVRAVVNAAGIVSERNDYYPFGLRHANASHSLNANNRLKFNGKEEQVAGNPALLDYGARMYDNVLGRFTGQDPLAFEFASISPFVFVSNNPVMRIDPTGMASYKFNMETGEMEWIDEEGGDERQHVTFVNPDIDGELQEVGTYSVGGANVYVDKTKNGWAISPVNLWEDMPSDLSGHEGYQYDLEDLKMRYQIRNGNSHALKVGLEKMERDGWAEPLTASNYWDHYGETEGSMRVVGMYINMMSNLTPGVGGSTHMRGGYSLNIRGSSSVTRIAIGKPNFAEFNRFRSENAGKFSGHSGRGTNTKVAWEAYKKAYGYK